MVERTCTLPGCTKPHRARGLCSTHYNQQHATPEQRHPKQTVPCTWCKTDCTKDAGRERRYQLFCSLACRDQWRKATGINPVPEPESRQTRRAQARLKLRRAARGTKGWTWTAGPCARCGEPFIGSGGGGLSSYCSEPCAKRSHRARRRALQRGAEVERYSRFAIFERDRWRCHICRRKVIRAAVVPHPLAPTIDHLVPLVAGGGDTSANVATAHFLCNSTKGERAGRYGDQLALIG
ncbi:HNH endonuclease [Streptomyces kaempferi]|uniref:HNH endonuclease n=1 Tax=Streptomyces kaempferi TaxID=333725 RepID=A0ABW3XKP2_9ACTN